MLDTIGTARLMKEEIERAQAAFSEARVYGLKWVDAGLAPVEVWENEARVIARVASAEAWAAIGLAYNKIESFVRAERATQKDPRGRLAWTTDETRSEAAGEGVEAATRAMAELDVLIWTLDTALAGMGERAEKGL